MPEPTLFDEDPAVKPVTYKEVPGYPMYRIGTDGSIWSRRFRNGRSSQDWRRMNPCKDKDGYFKIILCRGDGSRRHVRLHDLVLDVYVGPRPEGLVGAHENGQKEDCRPVNLRWKTQKDNIADKHRHGTFQIGETATNVKLTTAQVMEIRRRWSRRDTSQQILAAEYGVSNVTISAIVTRRNWKHIP